MATGPVPASFDEHLSKFDAVPLFMRSLPTESGTEDDSAALDAIQSLIHEGTPDEIAQNFKEQGNEYFLGKRFREAVSFYDQGLEAKPVDLKIKEALLGNRAACNLELKNYGKVLKDCAEIIGFNSKASKAYARSARALLALERWEDAVDICDRGLSFEPANTTFTSLRLQAQGAWDKQKERQQLQEALAAKNKEQRLKLLKAFKTRHLHVVYEDSQEQLPHQPHLDPEVADGLIFPVLFLYPQHATSDLIPTYAEDTPFEAVLATMFPPSSPFPDWDKKQEYTLEALNIYAITRRQRLLKVGKRMSLKDIFERSKEDGEGKADGLVLKQGSLTFIILPKGPVEKDWIDEFKLKRGT